MLKMTSRFMALSNGQSWPKTIEVKHVQSEQKITVTRYVTMVTDFGAFIKVTPRQAESYLALGLSVKEVRK